MNRDVANGWGPVSMLPRVALGVLSLPVVAGFVVLGAAVVVARSTRELAREAWSHLPAWRAGGDNNGRSEIDAA